METTDKKTMKKINVYQVSIQTKKRLPNGKFIWRVSPEYRSFDALLAAYKDWFEKHPGRSITFLTAPRFVPED